VPRPLRIAAEVALSSRLRDLTGRTRAGELEIDDSEPQIVGTVELAIRLGARLHLAPLRRDVAEVVLARIGALRDGRDAAGSAADIARALALAERLGLEVDLWEAQNRLWEWAGSASVRLDRDTVAELARRLWFDPPVFLRRAGLGAVAR
jgi:hypothetical protein